LDSFQDLRALADGVVIGKENLNFYAKFGGGLFGRMGLLKLIIVIAGRE
jgi:hypothetical protein